MQQRSKLKSENAASRKGTTHMTTAEYLKRPYGRLLVPDDEGGYRAEIIEFPGCFAEGETAAEAASNLEDAAHSWLEATLAKGQTVPEPMEELDYSGKLVVRLPKSLHRRAAFAANREGVSLNQFIVSSIAEQVGGYRWSIFNSMRGSLTFTLRVGTGKSQMLTQGFQEQVFFTPLAPLALADMSGA
jgi:predicted RNase H-like HicB family nuclease